MKISRIFGILLISSVLGCSRQPSQEPVTLTFLDVEWEASNQLPALGQDLEAFTQETGIQVKRVPAPDSPLKQLALWRELLEKGDGTPDLVGIDVIWTGTLNQYLMDLKPNFASDISSEDPTVVSAYTVGNKLVAVPRHAYVGILLYRADLLQRYGFREPPKTWDELERMALRIQAGERARGEKDFWGYVWPGGISEGLTCAGLEWQASEGGGRIIEKDGTISVNNPQTVRTWQRAKHWLGTFSPPGLIAYAKWDADNAWQTGKTVFSHGWASDYSLVATHPLPSGATRFGVTSLPGSKAGRAGTLGGNGLAVPRNSKHPRAAFELIRFLRRRDVEFMRSTEHSQPPKELQLFELPAVLHLYPQMTELRENGAEVAVRPSDVTGPKYEAVTRAYSTALHAVLTGEKTAPAAASDLEKELIEITGLRTGPPPPGKAGSPATVIRGIP